MNDTQKQQAQAAAHTAADKVATSAKDKAQASSGWIKYLWWAIAISAGAAAYFTLPSCTSAQREQVEGYHSIYHIMTGKPCIINKAQEGK